ncbi:hypothetical protein LPJ61_003198 [Coemansia biformis]|uniref:PH domain-containing protein n=1 Tax=Coemansia biformis TaxID=1286918 RepID=A0A9W8CXX9_9FUNG|nr:hypothetical protein LPJ61_003198 [Coemansia biformis]
MDADEDCWVVVDKTAGGELRAKGSHESLYVGDDSERARVHVQNRGVDLAPELVEWIHNAAHVASPTDRSPPASKCSYRTNSSSAGHRQRRPSAQASDTSSMASHESDDMFNEGTFIAKILEVRQRGATRPMNLQCVAQVGDEKLAIAPVMSRPVEHGTWASKLNDTFVFDVSRQFTFNLCVYGTQSSQPRGSSMLPHRVSLRQSLARNSIAVSTMSSTSFASTSSTRTSSKIKRGLRKIFRNRGDAFEGDADDPAYCGIDTAAAEDNSAVQTDVVLTEHQTDGRGRAIEVQRHTSESPASSRHGSFAQDAAGPAPLPLPLHLQPPPQHHQQQLPYHYQQQLPSHPAISRLSSYLPRSRTSTVASAHEIGYSGPRLRAFSNAASVGGTPTPQALGELYLDLKVDRREKRRVTFALPAINQEQVMMRGGSHVEMEVVMEYGIMVHETCEERLRRQQKEQQQRIESECTPDQERRLRVERQWSAVDEQDRQPRLRGYLSVFTRSGRASTWRRYWAVLCPTRILFFDSEADEERGTVPVKMSLFHMHRAGVPETDLISIGPTGIELHLSPLAMTDRHRRKSAFPRRKPSAAQMQRESARNPLPIMSGLTIGARRVDELSALLPDADDTTLEMYKEWHCRVYLLMETMEERARWLQELKGTCVPSCEFARFRNRQRGKWRTQEFEAAATTLRKVTAVAVEELPPLGKFASKKPAASPMATTNLVSSDDDEDLEGATLTSISGLRDARSAKAPAARKPMAFGKPATFDIVVSPADSTVRLPAPPAKKKMRARRRSSSVADLRSAASPPAPIGGRTLGRRDSASSMLVEVVGKAAERRPGTVSRRFLFVWNASDI